MTFRFESVRDDFHTIYKAQMIEHMKAKHGIDLLTQVVTEETDYGYDYKLGDEVVVRVLRGGNHVGGL